MCRVAAKYIHVGHQPDSSQMVSRNTHPPKTHVNPGGVTRKTISHIQKVHNATSEYEEAMEAAIDDVTSGRSTLREAAADHHLGKSTIDDRIKGRSKPRAEAFEPQQKLQGPQEDAIANWPKTQHRRGFPLRRDMAEDKANAILREQSKARGDDFEPVGQHWLDNFLKRHPDIAPVMSHPVDRARSRSNNPLVLESFYDVVSTYYY